MLREIFLRVLRFLLVVVVVFLLHYSLLTPSLFNFARFSTERNPVH